MTNVLDSWAVLRLLEGSEPAAIRVQHLLDPRAAGDELDRPGRGVLPSSRGTRATRKLSASRGTCDRCFASTFPRKPEFWRRPGSRPTTRWPTRMHSPPLRLSRIGLVADRRSLSFSSSTLRRPTRTWASPAADRPDCHAVRGGTSPTETTPHEHRDVERHSAAVLVTRWRAKRRPNRAAEGRHSSTIPPLGSSVEVAASARTRSSLR